MTLETLSLIQNALVACEDNHRGYWNTFTQAEQQRHLEGWYKGRNYFNNC